MYILRYVDRGYRELSMSTRRRKNFKVRLRDFNEVLGKIAKVREGKALSSKKSTMFSCLGHSGKFAGHCQNE